MNIERNPILHSTESLVFEGAYELSELACQRYQIKREDFGSTKVELSPDKSYRVCDFPYRLKDGNLGMRLIPVSDDLPLKDSEGQVQMGYTQLDELLRQEMDLEPQDPIYAFLSYFHPELNRGSLSELANPTSSTKPQMGFTHVGAYLGQGLTSNSPVMYHLHKFGVDGHSNDLDGYPAHVSIIQLDGVPQKVLNANAHLVDGILNHGVNFPPNYLEARFRIVDINTAFMFYRDWITSQPYLNQDESWFTYCMAHKTIVANISLNLPHNETAFSDVYGPNEGPKVFEAFKKKYYNVTGFDFTPELETHFEPLWKQQGYSAQDILPFTHEKYCAYEQARLDGRLDHFKGQKPLPENAATAWAPSTSADIVYDFVSAYADVLDAGPIVSSATILGFMEAIDERMGISKLEYLHYAMPVVQKLVSCDARVRAPRNKQYLESTFIELYKILGGTSLPIEQIEAEFKSLKDHHGFSAFLKSLSGTLSTTAVVAWAMWDVFWKIDEISSQAAITPEASYDIFCRDAAQDLENAKAQPRAKEGKIQYNMIPATLHLTEIGVYPLHPNINIKTLCTIVQSKDAQFKSE